MSPDQPQSGVNPSRVSSPSPKDRGRLAAIYVTIAAVAVAAVLNRSGVLNGWRLIAFLIGMLIFTVLADRTARLEGRPRLVVLLLIVQAPAMLALLPLGDYHGSLPILAFITISLSQFALPRRLADVFDAALFGAVVLVYGAAFGWGTALQVGAGYGAGAVFVIAFTRTAQREERARQQLETLYQDLEQANAQLAEYAAQVEQLATMRERNRLARDVHDSLGHYLTVINVQLEVVAKLIDADPNRARDAALKAKQFASEGLAEVRRSVAALRPSPLDDRPLPDAIRGLLDDARDAGLIVSFDQVGSARPLSPETETVLFRAAQESLTNIRKHARASSAGVRLAFETEAVRLRVRDNGIGRQGDPDNVGLSALRERVAALNGSVVAENHPDGGFLLEVALPYPDVSLGAAKNLIHNTADPSLTALPSK